MPIYVTIYHLDRLVVARTKGRVTLAHLEDYFDAITKARARSYGKIFDSTSGTSVLSEKHIAIFRERMEAFVAAGKVGPFAVVTGPERHMRLANICKTVATADRPMRFFPDIDAARRWLAEQMVADDAPPPRAATAGRART